MVTNVKKHQNYLKLHWKIRNSPKRCCYSVKICQKIKECHVQPLACMYNMNLRRKGTCMPFSRFIMLKFIGGKNFD